MNASAVTYAELGELLTRLRFGIGPSDLHGSLTGYLCGGGSADSHNWLAALELDVETAEQPIPQSVFADLYEQCEAWLNDPEIGFEPLLPAAAASLELRADALVQWCRGFLGGLGLAGTSHQNGLSSEGEEILKDFSTIASTNFEYAENEEDENALVEVIEFIRVGVLLLHAEMTAPAHSGETLH